MHGFPIRFYTTANAVCLKPLSHMSIMAGASGFGPLISRVRVCCLTTWRSPYNGRSWWNQTTVCGFGVRCSITKLNSYKNGRSIRIRTWKLWDQNPLPYHLAMLLKLVRMKRIELLRITPGDFKSPVSTYSTTLAKRHSYECPDTTTTN